MHWYSAWYWEGNKAKRLTQKGLCRNLEGKVSDSGLMSVTTARCYNLTEIVNYVWDRLSMPCIPVVYIEPKYELLYASLCQANVSRCHTDWAVCKLASPCTIFEADLKRNLVCFTKCVAGSSHTRWVWRYRIFEGEEDAAHLLCSFCCSSSSASFHGLQRFSQLCSNPTPRYQGSTQAVRQFFRKHICCPVTGGLSNHECLLKTSGL